MTLRLARTYAKALLQAAGSNEAGTAVRDELRRFVAAVAEVPQFGSAMASPVIPPAAKEKAVAALVERIGVGKLGREFLLLLVRNMRMAQLSAVLAAVEDLLNRRLGIAVAEVTTAVPLAGDDAKALAGTLERLVGRRVELRTAVDPKLLGGFVARVDSTLYDASLRGQLGRLAGRLAGA